MLINARECERAWRRCRYTQLIPLKLTHPFFYTTEEIALATTVPAIKHRVRALCFRGGCSGMWPSLTTRTRNPLSPVTPSPSPPPRCSDR